MTRASGIGSMMHRLGCEDDYRDCKIDVKCFFMFWERRMENNRAILREDARRADNDNLEASEKSGKAPEGFHDMACCSHLPLWHRARVLVGLQAQQGSPVNL